MREVSITATIVAQKDDNGWYTLSIHGTPPWQCRAVEFPDLIQAWRGLECVPQRLMDALNDSGRHRAQS